MKNIFERFQSPDKKMEKKAYGIMTEEEKKASSLREEILNKLEAEDVKGWIDNAEYDPPRFSFRGTWNRHEINGYISHPTEQTPNFQIEIEIDGIEASEKATKLFLNKYLPLLQKFHRHKLWEENARNSRKEQTESPEDELKRSLGPENENK